MNLPPIHPIMVHFPVALIVSAFALDVIGMTIKSDRFRAAVYPVSALALLGAIGAVFAGFYAESHLKAPPDDLKKLIEIHEGLAMATLIAISAATVFRVLAELKKNITGIMGQLSLILLFVATILVGATGYFGGEMVFTRGAGTAFYETVKGLSPAQEQPVAEPGTTPSPTYQGEEHPKDWH